MTSDAFSRRGQARSGRAWAALALCLSLSAATRGQSVAQGPPPPPRPAAAGLILGQVVDAAGGSIAGAVAAITGTNTGAPFAQRRMLTNADGRFLFTELPKGTYSIDVTKSGYAASGPGKLRPDGAAQLIELADGERNGSVKVTMWKFAAISGVLTDETGEPFVGATVWSLRRSYATGRSQMANGPSAFTDDRGYFRISALLPGDYVICVVASQTTLPAELVDAYGKAQLAGAVVAYDASRQLAPNAIGFNAGANTQGIRMGGFVVQTVGPYSRGMVPPGPDEGGRLLSFQTTFYPGVVSLSQADVITLGSGEERSSADIRLTLVPVAPVAGTVMGPSGPSANVGVRLAPHYSPDLGNELSFETALTVTDVNGHFVFMGVPAGQYILRALKVPQLDPSSTISIPQEPTLWANLPVVVGAEGVPDLAVKLSSGFRLSGKVAFEGTTAKPPVPATLRNSIVLVMPADGRQIGHAGALRGSVQADGTFATYEIPPGRYLVRYPNAGAGWTLKSVMFQGRDVSSVPLDLQSDVSGLQIVMTDRPTEISGTVRDESGKVDPKAAVTLFPSDRAEWTSFGESSRRLRILRPNSVGVFRVTGMPAGQYLIAAVPDAQAGDWQNPATLELLSRNAVPLGIQDADKKTQDVVSRRIR